MCYEKKTLFKYLEFVYILLDLDFLNHFKKVNKEQRRLQNKRYREKNKELLNLKKQFMYHKKTYESKLDTIL